LENAEIMTLKERHCCVSVETVQHVWTVLVILTFSFIILLITWWLL